MGRIIVWWWRWWGQTHWTLQLQEAVEKTQRGMSDPTFCPNNHEYCTFYSKDTNDPHVSFCEDRAENNDAISWSDSDSRSESGWNLRNDPPWMIPLPSIQNYRVSILSFHRGESISLVFHGFTCLIVTYKSIKTKEKKFLPLLLTTLSFYLSSGWYLDKHTSATRLDIFLGWWWAWYQHAAHVNQSWWLWYWWTVLYGRYEGTRVC